MATLIIHDFPDDVYQKLMERAEVNGRSLSSEVVTAVKQSLPKPRAQSGEAFVDKARKIRQLTSGYPITADKIEEMLMMSAAGRAQL
jgi:hypothetical protein